MAQLSGSQANPFYLRSTVDVSNASPSNMQLASAIMIQRMWRGFISRRYNSHTVAIVKASVRFSKQKKAALRIQKWVRGELVRCRLRRLIVATNIIQGFYKARWLHALFKRVMRAIKLIQRTFRALSLKRRVIQERFDAYIQVECSKFENSKVREDEDLYSRADRSVSSSQSSRYLSSTSDSVSVLSKLTLSSAGSSGPKPINPLHQERLYLFTRVLDFDLLTDTSLVYEPSWSKIYETFSNEKALRDEQILDIALGTCHTAAITNKGKVYVWGWSDRGQCGGIASSTKPRQCGSSKDRRVVQISAGDDHTLMLDSKGRVSAFGDNTRGQLGLGHFNEVIGVAQVERLPAEVVQLVSCGRQNLALTSTGATYMWPYETYEQERRSFPRPVLSDLTITEIAAGNNFALLLTNSGFVYSFGSNNSEGQLGQGDFASRAIPELVMSLRNAGEKVTGVACGFQHSVCRTSLGKLYAWGWGGYGQLGNGTLNNELSPRIVQFSPDLQRFRVVQCAAGYRHTVVMLESNKLAWFGTNSALYYSKYPTEIELARRLPDFFGTNEYLPIRILCSWSRSLNLTLLTIVDYRYVNQPKVKLAKTLSVLASKWSSRNSKS